jgi:hypothetical protein
MTEIKKPVHRWQEFLSAPQRRPKLMLMLTAAGLALFIWGLAAGASAFLQQRTWRRMNQHLGEVTSHIETPDPEQLRQLAVQARATAPFRPDIIYLYLYGCWRQALQDFEQVAAAQDNPYLAEHSQALLQHFHEGLLALREDADDVLQQYPDLAPAAAWPISNLKAGVSVLLAYSVLSYEQDGRKAAKFLNDALTDFKTAIKQVDLADGTSLQRTIPRWNLELIVGVGEYQRIGLAEIQQENLETVREQLEAYIPDVAGFTPGIPLEVRVEK